MIFGFKKRARAIHARSTCPPEASLGNSFNFSEIPNSLDSCKTRCSLLSFGIFAKMPGRAIFSAIDRYGCKSDPWKITPKVLR